VNIAHEVSLFILLGFFLTCRKSYDMGPTNLLPPPPKKVALRIFIALKNPSSEAGFEPAILGSNGKHAEF
jgi:hypothetical protein